MHICYEPEFSVIDTKDSCPGNGARLKKIGSGAKSDRSEIPKKKKLLISKRTNRVDDLERSGGSDAKDGEKKKKTIMKQLKSIVPRPGRLGNKKTPQKSRKQSVKEIKPDGIELMHHICLYVDNTDIQWPEQINEETSTGSTQLHFAVMACCLPCVIMLLNSDCDVDVFDQEGSTPLMYACKMNQPDICEVLLKHGAQVNLTNREGETAVHLAARFGQWGNNLCLKALLNYSPNVSIQNSFGLTALHSVLFQPTENDLLNIDIICDLLREGADLSAKCSFDEIYKGQPTDPFQLAVLMSHIPAVILLAEAGYMVPGKLMIDWSVGESIHPGCVQAMPKLKLYLEQKSASPQSLMSLCRTKIKKFVPSSRNAEHLGLPKLLIEYINFAGLASQCEDKLKYLSCSVT